MTYLLPLLPEEASPVGIGQVLDHVRTDPVLSVPPVVTFKNVTKTFNKGKKNEFTAIKDVTFTVDDLPNVGEFVVIVGPSGCGKSTILRLIAGLGPQFPATEGEIRVFGKEIEGPSADRGMVFQDYTSFDNRTVLDNIVFGLECRGVPRKERYDLGKQWIEKVGLSCKSDCYKYPSELSGGMRQRVAIARTLILNPRIVLMDEPFGALDPRTRLNIQDLTAKLWRDVQSTVFFITHSISEAVYLGDRVYIMSNGPGTILKEVVVPPPDKPARDMRKDHNFQDLVSFIENELNKLEEGKT